MANSGKKKEAIRPRSRFYFVITKLDGEFDFNLGYQYSDGALSFFSTAQRGATFKPPWGTPTSCQMKAYKNDEGCLVDHFRFTVRNGESRNIKGSLFNFFIAGENDFTRKCTTLIIDSRKELLALYMSLLPYSAGFSLHRPDLHLDSGIRKDGKGICAEDIVQKGATIEEFMSFKIQAESCAIEVSKKKAEALSVIAKSLTETNDKGKKCEVKHVNDDSELVNPKVAKRIKVFESELNDKKGIESALSDSYVGREDIKIELLSIDKKLSPMYNEFKVDGLVNSMRMRFDPSKIRLTVAPADTTNFNRQKLSENKYVVVSGIHRLAALKKLDAKGEMRTLNCMKDGVIPCYIINPLNPQVLCYENLKSNDLEATYAAKAQLEDLLFVHRNFLQLRMTQSESEETIVRYSKLLLFSADDISALKRLLNWNVSSFIALLAIIEKFRRYETTDAKRIGSKLRLERGQKMAIPKNMFHKLSKVDESYFVKHVTQVRENQCSLKDLIDNYGVTEDHKKTLQTVCKIAKTDNIDSLRLQYPGKFDDTIIQSFSGAIVEGPKQNPIGRALNNYMASVLNSVSDKPSIELQFEELSSEEDLITSFPEADVIVFNLDDKNIDYSLQIYEQITCGKISCSCILMYPNWKIHIDVLSCLSSRQSKDDQIFQLFFDQKVNSQSDVAENLKCCILVMRKRIYEPPIEMYNNGLENLGHVISKLCPPYGTIVFAAVGDSSIVNIHRFCNDRTIKYLAYEKNLQRFKSKVEKENVIQVQTNNKSPEMSSKEVLKEKPSIFKPSSQNDQLGSSVNVYEVMKNAAKTMNSNVLIKSGEAKYDVAAGFDDSTTVGEDGKFSQIFSKMKKTAFAAELEELGKDIDSDC